MEFSIEKNLLREIKEKINQFRPSFSARKIFQELCFCTLVANNNLERTLEIWKRVKKDLIRAPQSKLKLKLKKFGYRFYNKRSGYIIFNRRFIKDLKKNLKSLEGKEMREWLSKNIMGIGYKEASHFLRNMGHKNLAIIDTHVLQFLLKHKMINKIPKSITKKKYLELEVLLENIAKKLKISLAELDLYIFYKETGVLPKR